MRCRGGLAIEGNEGNDVFETLRLEFDQKVPHPELSQLEDARF